MPRPDYEKFIYNFNGTVKDLKVYATELYPKFLYSFAKVCNVDTVLIEETSIKCKLGVNIDVFPIDGISIKDKKLMKKQIFRRSLLNIKTIKLDSTRALWKNIILIVGKIALFWISIEYINSRMIKAAKTYSFENEEYSCNVSTGLGIDSPVPKKYFEEPIKCTFEKETFVTTKFYHEWLTSIYGDYMQLPPKEERISHHKFKAYAK